MHTEHAELLASELDAAATYAPISSNSALPRKARDVLDDAARTVAEHGRTVRAAVRRAAEVAGDVRIYPEGRAQAITTTAGELAATVNGLAGRLDVQAAIARGHLTRAASRKVGDPMLARADATMILDKASDKTSALVALARRDDDIGALVASNWGRDYLLADGMDEREAATLHESAQREAALAAADSTDPARRAAAQALVDDQLGKAHATLVTANTTAAEHLAALAAAAGHDSRDDEIKRLRRILANERGHALEGEPPGEGAVE
jgi:hypothetical protein